MSADEYQLALGRTEKIYAHTHAHTQKPEEKYDEHQLASHEKIRLTKSVTLITKNGRLKPFGLFLNSQFHFG